MAERRLRDRRRRDERGSTTPMLIGFALFIAITMAVVIDASAAYLRRQDLASLAEGAALVGADLGAQGEEVYTGGFGDRPLEITAARARTAVADYLGRVGAHGRHDALRYEVSVSADRVVVRISSSLDLPLSVPGVADSVRVSATGSAISDPE